MDFLVFVVVLVVIKSITIGSDFSFYYWLKHGKKYTKWYTSRESFIDYLKKES